MSYQKLKYDPDNPDKLTRGPLPLHYQAANLIRAAILEGTLPPGSRLPTENELTKKYGVSRPTIRHAKAILTAKGLIKNIKGSGCYVNHHKTWKNQPPIVENLNDIFHTGLQMSFKMFEYGMILNTDEIKGKLKNPDDKFVFRIKGVRLNQNQPISWVVYYLPFRLGSRIPLENLDERPFIPQIEKMAGIQVKEGIQNISLGPADKTAAKNLGLKKGDAVLVVRTVYFDAQQQPVEYVETKYRNDLPYAIRVRRD